jgi:ribonuclease P protein component
MDFEASRGGKVHSTPHFRISYKLEAERGGSAVIVPKKVVMGAVGRHLLKRRIREVLRPWSARDRILIVSARSGAETLPYQELQSELSGALSAILGGHNR